MNFKASVVTKTDLGLGKKLSQELAADIPSTKLLGYVMVVNSHKNMTLWPPTSEKQFKVLTDLTFMLVKYSKIIILISAEVSDLAPLSTCG